jgi:hypothetical protein
VPASSHDSKSFGLCTTLLSPWRQTLYDEGLHPFATTKTRPPRSLIWKDHQACTKHSSKLWSRYKRTAMHRRFHPQQWCHFSAYDSAISSFKIHPLSVHCWNFVQFRIYPLLDSRPFLQFWTCVRSWTRQTAGTCGIPTSQLAASVITTPPQSPF